MEERKVGKEKLCNMILENRTKLSVSGVVDVDSFDDENVILITELGTLVVKGTGFHINKLNVDIGELVIEGQVDSCVYNDSYATKNKGSLLSRMFK